MAPYKPRALSVSQVDCYLRCPALWQRRYVQRIHDPATGAMLFGTVMAKALEALHRGQDGEVAFIREYSQQITGPGVRGAASLGHGLALLAAYRRLGVAVGEPEVKFEFYLPDREAVPVPILGYGDCFTATEVIEVKTSRGGWDQGRCDQSPQAAVYAWAYQRLYARRPQAVRFLVFSTRAVRIDTYLTYPASGELRLFELQAAAVWRGIRDQQFAPRCRQCPACAAAGLVAAPRATVEWEMPA